MPIVPTDPVRAQDTGPCPAIGCGRRWPRRSGLLAVAAAFTLPWLARPAAAAQEPGTAAPLLVLGDSLSAEYGLARGTGWVALLEQRLRQRQHPLPVINASISGETTAGGRTRLPALLAAHQPGIVIIELGGNDALRGLPLRGTQDNLEAMVRAAQAAGARVLLLGMQVPPNYGSRYTQEFAQMFADVAQKYRTVLVPFLLAGIGDAPDAAQWFQSDRIHPNARAQPRMRDTVWEQLHPLLP